MFYYDHHIGDFRAATAYLPDNLQYAYLKLLWVYYDTQEPLPNNPAKLALWSGVSQDQALLIMDEFFDLHDDHWVHARCQAEIEVYLKHQKASSAGGKKRAANAAAKRQGPLKAPSAPLQATSNQEPVTSTVQPKEVERTGKTGKRFVPPTLDQVKDYWREKNLNGDPEHFRDHFENCDWRLSGGRGKVMKKWRLAANNWSRNQAVFDPKSGGSKGGRLQLASVHW